MKHVARLYLGFGILIVVFCCVGFIAAFLADFFGMSIFTALGISVGVWALAYSIGYFFIKDER